MAFKVVLLLASVMVAHAIVLPGGIVQQSVLTKNIEVEAPAQYQFSYEVNDPTTGDVKSQQEVREGDVVKGAYALIDPDGLQRVVQYTSDGINGFNAVVSRTPLTKQVAVASPVIKTIQPTLIKSVPSLIQSPLAGISLQSPLIRTTQLGQLGQLGQLRQIGQIGQIGQLGLPLGLGQSHLGLGSLIG